MSTASEDTASSGKQVGGMKMCWRRATFILVFIFLSVCRNQTNSENSANWLIQYMYLTLTFYLCVFRMSLRETAVIMRTAVSMGWRGTARRLSIRHAATRLCLHRSPSTPRQQGAPSPGATVGAAAGLERDPQMAHRWAKLFITVYFSSSVIKCSIRISVKTD